MSVSLPSKEIYAVDVPEVTGLKAQFQYNFWTRDESVSDTGGVPSGILERSGDSIDSSFIHYATTRAPRLVTISYKAPKLVAAGNFVSERVVRDNVFSTNAQNGSLISDNIDKVVTEDEFASDNFIGITFNDGEIDDKIHALVSGSYVLHTLNDETDVDVSHVKAALRLNELTPKHIKPAFLTRAMNKQSRAHGSRFFSKNGTRRIDKHFVRLKDVTANAQVNGKFMFDMTNRTIKDPNSPYTLDLQGTLHAAEGLKNRLSKKSNALAENDYKTFIRFIDVQYRKSAHLAEPQPAQIVGYIIDRVEILPGNKTKQLSPIIIDNPKVTFTADFQVKYGTTYAYTARSVALFTVPAIDVDTSDVALLRVLVSSKPSNKVYVTTTEMKAPPCPSDVSFTWDYDRINPSTAEFDVSTGKPFPNTGVHGSLMIHWTFPPNSQRDIKKFQVFRRRDENEPFELIKVYDFDDSLVRYEDEEDPDEILVERLTTPCTFFYDDDFHAGNYDHPDLEQGTKNKHPWSSTYVYAIASVDAHGLSSCYSAQFEVWFDPFKNRIEKRLVSHSGAPKPYPNLYLEADAFVDTIRVNGPNSKHVKLYFNPEHYAVIDDDDAVTQTFEAKQRGGSYKLQFINTDNQKSAVVNVTIDDRSSPTKTVKKTNVQLGKRRKQRTRRVVSH